MIRSSKRSKTTTTTSKGQFHEQKMVTSRATKRTGNRTEIGSDIMHSGLWSFVFSYLRLDQEILKLRLVSRKWKGMVERSIEARLKQIDSDVATELAFCDELDEPDKAALEQALKRREAYQHYLPLIPRRWVLFERLSDIAKLKNPPVCISEAISAVLNLVTTEEQFQKNKGVGWKDCQAFLKRKDVMPLLQRTTPETLDQNKIRRFEHVVNRSMITPDYLHHECNAAAFMLSWGLALVACAKSDKEMTPETFALLSQWVSAHRRKARADSFQSVFKKFLKS